MALLSRASQSIVDAMTPVIAQPATTAPGDKIYHLEVDARIESIRDAPKRDTNVLGSPGLIATREFEPKDDVNQRMQAWWEEAIAKNMDVSDTYSKVAVLIVKWADDLDDLKTRAEAEELDAVFRELFKFTTETVELNVASKPQLQINRHMSAFVDKHDGPHNLLIVYYTGHGVYREDKKYLELTAKLDTDNRCYWGSRCNWNKVEEILQTDDVESDILTILDTCYSSNVVQKSGREETKTFEFLSACAINQTTAAPGSNSFTRALIDTLKELHTRYGDKGFTTVHLNQGILLDKRRQDAPSQLWFRMQREHYGRHIHLSPLKPRQTHDENAPRLRPVRPRGFLTLQFALRDESLTQEQIEFLALHLSKALNNKKLLGLSRISWQKMESAPPMSTPLGRVALAMFAIAQWKKVIEKRRQERRRLDEVRLPIVSTVEEPLSATSRKRSRDSLNDSPEPERKRDYLVISQPPSPPVSNSSSS
ncbi:hypothetical protein BU23DRAFT_319257 [Bimuria novae-zelandiae CBS 107.79]|uniref:Peptidase C14 caspase domain-containing protein n=1 Tax=Bimuria novae-zelandiae CBS 107.79 TaxID=1447943 RepID=A0A6A5VV15_9PLEO|nr:hypothetical protein BU23DRAFT_319257 [Bimuria novae-zelandiae CBS 107.79]